MMYDLTTFLFWILLAAVIGGFVGWHSWSDDKRPDWLRSWLLPATLAFGIGALLALLSVLPGRAGLWLEVALLTVSAYVLGCLSGGQLKEYVGLGDSSAMAPGGPGTSAAFTAAPAPPARPWADSPSPAAQAAASIEADRLAAEAAAKAEADRLAAEAAAAKAEADRLAAEAEADQLAAEVAASAPTTVTADDRPRALPAPDGTADDLKLIKGIGPKNERILNEIGVHHFSQIAAWSPGQASWVGDHMAFPGRIEREHWIAQAKLLAAGLDTAHSSAVKSGAITIDDTADAPLSGDEADALLAQLPDLAPAVENEDAHAGRRPLGLAAPRGGQADDLKLIKGIGKQNEARLHGLGIWHFAQIAAWTPDHAKWVGSYLAFAGRIEREQWIAQAEELASGGTTEFARRVEAGLVKSSLDDGSHGQDNIEIVQPRE